MWDFPTLETEPGRNGGTWAHWQIALAYAKYLSPEFHMWCNTVVRAHMEGRTHAATPVFDSDRFVQQIAATLDREVARRLDEMTAALDREMARRLDELMPQIARRLDEMIPQLVAATIAQRNLSLRRGRTAGQIWRDMGHPPIKGAAKWFGNVLGKVGCSIDGKGRGELGTTTARLFDPDKVQNWVNRLEGRTVIDRKIKERLGQNHLHLVGGRYNGPVRAID
jgi:hypothetical protein